MPPVIRDVAAGLWIWRVEHPDWAPHVGWDPAVTSTCVESGGEVVVIDALVPETGADAVWAPARRPSADDGRRPEARPRP